MPPARRKTGEERVPPRRLVIEMERLRIIFRGEFDDLAPIHHMIAEIETVAHLKVEKGKAGMISHCHHFLRKQKV